MYIPKSVQFQSLFCFTGPINPHCWHFLLHVWSQMTAHLSIDPLIHKWRREVNRSLQFATGHTSKTYEVYFQYQPFFCLFLLLLVEKFNHSKESNCNTSELLKSILFIKQYIHPALARTRTVGLFLSIL